VNYLSAENIAPFYEKWEAVNKQIKKLYDDKDSLAFELMRDAIQNYTNLLEYGGKNIDERTGLTVYILMPLNGEERFEFVKDRIASHYAYIQLDALFTETRKKAAGLSIKMT